MKVVCVATGISGYYKNLQESCKRYNFDLITLGFNMKWGGFTMKFDLMKNYLNQLNEDEIVMFVDAYDVFMNDFSRKVISRFESFNKKILFSSEFTNPNYSNLFLLENIAFDKCKSTIINSGCYMGYVSYLKKLFNLLCERNDCSNYKLDDQKLLNKLCNIESEFFDNYIAIDYDGLIFYTMKCDNLQSYILPNNYKCNSSLIEENGKLINTRTNLQPIVIHGPFNLKLDNFIQYKGFIPKNMNRNSTYTLQSMKGFYKEIILCSLFLLIFIIIIFAIGKSFLN